MLAPLHTESFRRPSFHDPSQCFSESLCLSAGFATLVPPFSPSEERNNVFVRAIIVQATEQRSSTDHSTSRSSHIDVRCSCVLCPSRAQSRRDGMTIGMRNEGYHTAAAACSECSST
eukprot:768431-Hanusia_phi.AAC.12